jgi:hypothetical protein
MEKGEIEPRMALKTTEAIPNLSAGVLETLAAAWKAFNPDTTPVIWPDDPSVTSVQGRWERSDVGQNRPGQSPEGRVHSDSSYEKPWLKEVAAN